MNPLKLNFIEDQIRPNQLNLKTVHECFSFSFSECQPRSQGHNPRGTPLSAIRITHDGIGCSDFSTDSYFHHNRTGYAVVQENDHKDPVSSNISFTDCPLSFD